MSLQCKCISARHQTALARALPLTFNSGKTSCDDSWGAIEQSSWPLTLPVVLLCGLALDNCGWYWAATGYECHLVNLLWVNKGFLKWAPVCWFLYVKQLCLSIHINKFPSGTFCTCSLVPRLLSASGALMQCWCSMNTILAQCYSQSVCVWAQKRAQSCLRGFYFLFFLKSFIIIIGFSKVTHRENQSW